MIHSTPPMILRLDISGNPVAWTHWQDAVYLYAREKVGWTMGASEFRIFGGINRRTGERSSIAINSIIAVHGSARHSTYLTLTPPLSNRELFHRDAHMCMYCGTQLAGKLLTRDHIVPINQGGKDTWSNLVTACRSCNSRKGGRTPEQANMPLLAIPYVPNWAEYLALTNRKILADQMGFLRTQFGKNSRLLTREQTITTLN